MSFELKPCPFCGGEAHLLVQNGVRVKCQKCSCQTMMLTDGESANGKPYGNAVMSVVDKWNNRVETVQVRSDNPRCFGSYRSPQSNAENSCEDCASNEDCWLACHKRGKYAASKFGSEETQ